MAATCTHRVITPDTGNTPNTSGSITFASGDLLVVFVTKEASALSSPMASGDLTATSITGVSSFTLIRNQGHQSSAAHMGVFVADQKTTGSGTTGTVTIGNGSDAGAGTIISVYTVAGMPAGAVGAAAVRQSGGQTDQAAGTPGPSFPGAALTGNPCLGGIYNATNPAGMTEPSGWSAGGNSGYTTGQVSGLGTCHRNSGETGTTITWGSSSASAFASIIAELAYVALGATTASFTYGSTTQAKVGAKGASASTYTFGSTTVGRIGKKGASDSAYTASLTTQGTRALRAQAAVSLTTGLTTQGVRTVLGSSSLSLSYESTTAGDISGGAATLFGASALDLTTTLTTSGYRALLALAAQDSVDGAWTDQGGGSDLRGALDELVYSDADYIRSELQPAASACRVKLEGLTDPSTSAGHRLRWRIAKDAADGATVDMAITLYQGGGDVLGAGTEIASFTRTDVSETFTSYVEELSGAQADAISDYANLYVEMEATVG